MPAAAVAALSSTSPSAVPSATAAPKPSGGAFSKALDDAASRRAEDPIPAPQPPAEGGADAAAPAESATRSETAGPAPLDPMLAALMAHREPVPIDLVARGTTPPAADAEGGLPTLLDGTSLHSPSARAAALASDPLVTNLRPAATDESTGATPGQNLSAGAAEGPALSTLPRELAPVATLPAAAAPSPFTLPGATPDAGPIEARIPTRVDHPGFGAAFGVQLSLLARDGVKEARLQMNPAELGPVTVQITVTGQIARIDMVADQPYTRQVLEQAMPVLASALRENGLTLTGGGVFEQPRHGGQPGSAPGQPGRAGAGDGGEVDADEAGSAAQAATLARGAARGVLDLYA